VVRSKEGAEWSEPTGERSIGVARREVFSSCVNTGGKGENGRGKTRNRPPRTLWGSRPPTFLRAEKARKDDYEGRTEGPTVLGG